MANVEVVRVSPASDAADARRKEAGSRQSEGPKDLLLALGASRSARQLLRVLGLPVSLPVRLRRTTAPWSASPLRGAAVALGGGSRSELTAVLRRTLAGAGGEVYEAGAEAELRSVAAGEALTPRTLTLSAIDRAFAPAALVFDATSIEAPAQLRALYDFFHPLIGRLAAHGRVVVLGRPSSSAPSPTAAAAAGALEGFVRSLAKEIGRKGATAQLVTVAAGSEARVEPVLRFLLSEASAFVTGQSLPISATVPLAGSPPLVRPLDGKVALVTGAARGIGAATAQRLAAEGAHVVCLDRAEDEPLLGAVARSVGGTPLLADVSQPSTPADIARHLGQAHGGVDVVVHNAGITRDKTLARMEAARWDQTLEVNLAAVTRIDAALDAGVIRDGARLIYLSSVVGIAGTAGQTNYSSAKAGLIAYARARAQRLASRGIAVNAVAPGFIETRLTAAMPMLLREAGRRLNCLSQGGVPDDVGHVITFLASPGAAGLTGATLRVCGGALLGA